MRLVDVGGVLWAVDWIGLAKCLLAPSGRVFRKQLLTKPAHWHQADDEGPAWQQSARSGWLLLRGPSSEFWFDKWVTHLLWKVGDARRVY